MTFEIFSEQVRASNLTPRKCRDDHWQIRGGKFCVNFYPFKDGGPSFYVNAMNSGSRHRITLADAIAAANSPPINKLHRRTRNRKKSYRGSTENKPFLLLVQKNSRCCHGHARSHDPLVQRRDEWYGQLCLGL